MTRSDSWQPSSSMHALRGIRQWKNTSQMRKYGAKNMTERPKSVHRCSSCTRHLRRITTMHLCRLTSLSREWGSCRVSRNGRRPRHVARVRASRPLLTNHSNSRMKTASSRNKSATSRNLLLRPKQSFWILMRDWQILNKPCARQNLTATICTRISRRKTQSTWRRYMSHSRNSKRLASWSVNRASS